LNGPLLVATDGAPGAAGALHWALALNRRGMGPVLVLAVQDPIPLYDTMESGLVASARLELDRIGLRHLRETVHAQVAEIAGDAPDWEVRIEAGPPGMLIADAAEAHGAALVLAGLGRHSAVERLFGGETSLAIIQLAHAPVLAVHPDARVLPRRVLIADDFSEFSREAARRALGLLEPGGELHVAHVLRMPGSEPVVVPQQWLDRYLGEVETELKERGSALAADVRTHLLQGDPASELLGLAESIEADLLVAGRHGRGFLGRLLIGSISTRLVRRARCSVLVVPQQARAVRA
jgi:nucleotide-binding universal stress UspA family protein